MDLLDKIMILFCAFMMSVWVGAWMVPRYPLHVDPALVALHCEALGGESK